MGNESAYSSIFYEILWILLRGKDAARWDTLRLDIDGFTIALKVRRSHL